MQQTTAIILAAGRGKRLEPFTKTLPKCLLTIDTYPILYYQLKALQNRGVTNLIMVVGYKKNKIITYIARTFPTFTVTYITNAQYKKTNTLYSLSLVDSAVINPDHQVILLNGDVIFEENILFLVLQAKEKNLAVTIKKTCYEEEIKVFCKNKKIVFLRKDFIVRKYVGESIGIYKFSPRCWHELSQKLLELQRSYSHEYFEFAIEKILPTQPLYPLLVTSMYAMEIDFPQDLAKVKKDVKTSDHLLLK